MSDQPSPSGNRVLGGVWRRRRVAVLAGGVALLAAGGAAYATIPDAGTQVIHSCYDKTTGALRVIDPSKSQTCTSSETALNWNGRGLNFRAGWNATTAYSPGDVVTLGGGSYVARAANLNSTPPSANWTVLGSPSYSSVASESNESNPETFPVLLSSNLTNVIAVGALPAGNYTVNAQVALFVDNGAQDVQCLLEDSHGNFANGYAETSGPADPSNTGTVQTLNLTDAFGNEPAGTHILVKCAKANGADSNTTEAVSASLSANAVGFLRFNGRNFVAGG
jgi:hypothetical protein